MTVPTGYQGDWNRIAKVIVNQALEVQPGERVLVWADPTFFPELTEQVRIEVVRAGAVEVGTMILQSPALETVRRRHRRREDSALKRLEDTALAELFKMVDVFI